MLNAGTQYKERTHMTTRPLLEVQDLQKVFTVGTMLNRKNIHAIRNVSFSIQAGETFALVGESGCGKSTTGRAIIRLTKPTSGTVKFNSVDLGNASNSDIRTMRRDIQMVFQDPYASLNPRMTIGKILAEPYRLHNLYSQKEREEKVIQLMEEVGLRSAYRNRFPHEFSGGQRQRIGIARALALNPK
jgi:oligopeptide transport system ATP-binding protein